MDIGAPLKLYDQLYQDSPSTANATFIERLVESVNSSNLPLLHANKPLDRIPDGHLVCLRGMVQDMFDEDLYIDHYEKICLHSGQVKFGSAKFREHDQLEDGFELVEKSFKFSERSSFFVVPIPGQSHWSREIVDSSDVFCALHAGVKRRQPDDKESSPNEIVSVAGTNRSRKHFPLEEEESLYTHSTGVIIRLYDLDVANSLRITDMVKVVGIIEHVRLGEAREDGFCGVTVPKIHVMTLEKMTHSNPLPLETITDPAAVRTMISQVLTLALRGDELTVEYLILHMVAKLKPRLNEKDERDTFPGINLWALPENVPSDSADCLVKRLGDCLRNLLPQLVPVKVDIESLNKGPLLMPVKEPETGKLQPGRLQLPSGSLVLADETQMQAGQLDARGLLNLQALASLAVKSELPYDFQNFQHIWPADARVLVLSTSQSLVKPLITLAWSPDQENRQELDLSHIDWNACRVYLTSARMLNDQYTVGPDLQQRINGDFVRLRKDKATYIEAEDLFRLLNMLKAYSVSHGRANSTIEDWQRILDLEVLRKKRNADALPAPSPINCESNKENK